MGFRRVGASMSSQRLVQALMGVCCSRRPQSPKVPIQSPAQPSASEAEFRPNDPARAQRPPFNPKGCEILRNAKLTIGPVPARCQVH